MKCLWIKRLVVLAAVLFVSGNQATQANLIINGGFETGNNTAAPWAFVNRSATTVVSDPVFIHSGGFGLQAGPQLSTRTMSQTISVANPLDQFSIDLWFKPFFPVNNGSITHLDVSFGGVLLFSLDLTGTGTIGADGPDANATPDPVVTTSVFNSGAASNTTGISNEVWKQLSFTNLLGGNGVLTIGFRDDDYYLGIDDITLDQTFDANAVPTVPEPSSILLLGMGAFGAAIGAFRRRRVQSKIVA